MSCCGTVDETVGTQDWLTDKKRETFEHAGHQTKSGSIKYVLSVPSVHCGGCIATIETELKSDPNVIFARVNLTLKRLVLEVTSDFDILTAVARLEKLGFTPTPIDLGDLADLQDERKAKSLLKAMAVAGFAAGNIMLLSVSVWSGADDASRDFFHLLSALIAVPVVAYSGRVFFSSAITALSNGRLNMEVPISLALILALGMSLFETLTGGQEAYFDAATTLLFFLLIGRYLDQRMRNKARNAVVALTKMASKGAYRITDDDELIYTPVDEIMPNMRLRVFVGESVPVDCTILLGETELDRSLVTGESAPVLASQGSNIEAGCLNLSGPIDVCATKSADMSFIAEVSKMLETAENGRGTYVRIADRMARIYAPVVHILSFLAFVGWMIVTRGDWHTSLTVAISVLLITCPCALGLAVPVVHVVGASRLFQHGILMRDGSALERLAEVTQVVFDKTGTLTMGTASVLNVQGLAEADKSAALSLAEHSSHPAARAVAKHFAKEPKSKLDDVREIPAMGCEAYLNGSRVRLGRPNWVAEILDDGAELRSDGRLAFARENGEISYFSLQEEMRQDAPQSVSALIENGLDVEVLSGDARLPVAQVAKQLGIADYQFEQTPRTKLEWVERLQTKGNKVLVVGDGVNDAPALAAGHASMAPASAADVGRHAADFVFTRDSLGAVPFAFRIAKKAGSLVRQNFGLAILYNLIAVPLAVSGMVTPLVAAIAMSSSSIVVILNSLRLLKFDDGSKRVIDLKSDQRIIHTEVVAQ